MENTHQASTPTLKVLDGQKLDFNDVINNFKATAMPTMDFLKKNPVSLVMVYALPILVAGALLYVLLPILFLNPIAAVLGLVFSILWFISALLAPIALIKAAIEVNKGNKVNIVGSYMTAAKCFIGVIILGVKSFLQIFKGIYPFLNSAFSLVYFLEHDGKDADAAIKMSQDSLQGKTITMILNLVVAGVAVGIVNAIVNIILGIVFGLIPYVGGLGTVVAAAVIPSFSILFQYILKGQLEKMKGAAPHTAAPAASHS